ncbi:MAG: hypothetical protein PWP27_927 [Clostridiales bacterium]|nr:hypothetical protein [Clostridiales bacterium]MDK2933117.1 hypothetical protein [Clostridiales bacterium]
MSEIIKMLIRITISPTTIPNVNFLFKKIMPQIIPTIVRELLEGKYATIKNV